jgi:type III secretion protein U
MSEKTEEPTKKKLRESAEQGEVPQSPVVVRLVASIGLLELISASRSFWLPALTAMVNRPFEVLGANPSVETALLSTILMSVLTIAALISVVALMLAAALALAANLLQVGFMVAPDAVPKWDALDAVSNLTQMFSKERLVELLLNLAKVICIGGCGFFAIYSSLESILHLADRSLSFAFHRLLDVVVHIERTALVTIIVLVALDWVAKRHYFMQQMMMSVEDVKREHKDDSGDPHMRQHRKDIGNEIAVGDPVANTRKADAIVTNPTHFAVAISFRPHQAPLPIVLARGTGALALRMVEVGKKVGIPRVRYVWLARTLYSVGREGRPIPRITLRAVAAVYRALNELIEQNTTLDQAIELGTDPDDPSAYPSARPADE